MIEDPLGFLSVLGTGFEVVNLSEYWLTRISRAASWALVEGTVLFCYKSHLLPTNSSCTRDTSVFSLSSLIQ